MKIIILHGDYTIKSYERLQNFIKEARRRGWEIINIKNQPKLSLPEQLTARHLFSQQSLFIIDEPLKLTSSDLNWLKTKSNNLTSTLVIYYSGYLPQYIIKSLQKVYKIEEYKLPKFIWKFLDSFYPGNINNCLKLFQNVLKNESCEFVLALLAKQLRDLYWLKIDPQGLSYPSWRLNKLKRQSKKFSENLLKNVIKDLAEADIKSKTSKANLKDSLDFLIVTHLE